MKRTVSAWLLSLGVGLGVIACGGGTPQTAPDPVLYPPPPDTARLQFLTGITSERDLGRGRSTFSRIVGESEEIKIITKPYGIALHAGKMYVCDESILGIDVVDLQERRITFFQPSDPHGIRRAINCFVDRDGTLYVTDTGARQVLVFDSTLAFVARFGDEEQGNPVDVFVTGDRIFVSHLSGRKIRVYDRTTRAPLYGFPDAAPSDSNGLAAPANIFVVGDRVYASDMLKQQVLVYTVDGTHVQTIGRPGLGPGTFARPKGIAVDRDGLVYVVDGSFDNVQVFGPDGQLLMYFGGPGETPGSMVLPAKVVVDYDHLEYFERYVAPGYRLRHLLIVTNQFGPRRIGVYGYVEPSSGRGGGR